MIISVEAEKVFLLHPTFFHDKNIQQTRNRRELSQPDKGHLWKIYS